MRNQPKYHFFKNTSYALSGFLTALKNETSFRLELVIGIFLMFGVYYIDINLSYKLILFATGILILIAELLNSAIENVVDLVTLDYHELAKNAKDLGSAAVMLSIILHFACWGFVLINKFV